MEVVDFRSGSITVAILYVYEVVQPEMPLFGEGFFASSPGDGEGNREGPGGEEDGPNLVHQLGRGTSHFHGAGQFETSCEDSGVLRIACDLVCRLGVGSRVQSLSSASGSTGVADDVDQKDFENPSQVLVVKESPSPLLLLDGRQGQSEAGGLEHLACPSASAWGTMSSSELQG